MIKIISLHFKDIYSFCSLQTWHFFLFCWLLCLTSFQHQQQPQPLPQASPQLGGLYNEPGMQLRYSDLHSAPDNRQNVTNTKSLYFWICLLDHFYLLLVGCCQYQNIVLSQASFDRLDLLQELFLLLKRTQNLQWNISFSFDLWYCVLIGTHLTPVLHRHSAASVSSFQTTSDY